MEDNSTASADDTVITLRSGWLLQIGNGCDWVRNGESLTITGLWEDGSATFLKTGKRFGSSSVL